MEQLVGDLDLRFVFVGGKGGVGKTTSSASLATCFSQRSRYNRVLLISTDPAHSLGDAFQREFPKGQPTAVSPTLDVLEVDPEATLEEELQEWTKLMEEGGMADAGASMGEFQDWLRQIPGIDEATAISNVINFIEEDKYDLVVFDTAPTGHTLKLLQLPKILSQGMEKLQSWSTTLWTYMSTVVGTSSSNNSNPVDAKHAMETRLKEYKRSMDKVSLMLKDHYRTQFVIVCIAEYLSVMESKRLMSELKKNSIKSGFVICNQLLPVLEITDQEEQQLLHPATLGSTANFAGNTTNHDTDTSGNKVSVLDTNTSWNVDHSAINSNFTFAGPPNGGSTGSPQLLPMDVEGNNSNAAQQQHLPFAAASVAAQQQQHLLRGGQQQQQPLAPHNSPPMNGQQQQHNYLQSSYTELASVEIPALSSYAPPHDGRTTTMTYPASMSSDRPAHPISGTIPAAVMPSAGQKALKLLQSRNRIQMKYLELLKQVEGVQHVIEMELQEREVTGLESLKRFAYDMLMGGSRNRKGRTSSLSQQMCSAHNNLHCDEKQQHSAVYNNPSATPGQVNQASHNAAKKLHCYSRLREERRIVYPELMEQDDEVFPVGLSVEIFGLAKTPQYNGVIGTVKSYDAQTMRYGVFVEHLPTQLNVKKLLALKPSNLRHAANSKFFGNSALDPEVDTWMQNPKIWNAFMECKKDPLRIKYYLENDPELSGILSSMARKISVHQKACAPVAG
ncbi:unnamed protein product [Amoebophrya sp. A120]|nr:unnamed protein product [Amoebophrya sp. A120]|eukprot:GSA120T00024515001.1